MQIILSTRVNLDFKKVYQRFDEKLFTELAPPFPPLNVVQFDGCIRGDLVKVRLGWKNLGVDWWAEIIESNENENEIYFIDRGMKLPFPLKTWEHYHGIKSLGNNETLVVDNIQFSSGSNLIDYLIYPLLWITFAYRKPIYRKVFNPKW
jgi:ligand-binding SRPBCC domain-containing protein